MRILAGLAGGVMATLAMDAYVWALSAGGRQREAEDATPGGDRLARGVQPAQAEGSSSHDAPVRVGAAAYRAVTGDEPERSVRPWLGTAAHYGLGLAAGLCYGIAIDRAPWLRAGFGTLYGALVWVVADEGLVPAAGLSRRPLQLSPSVHAFALGGHLAFGAALEGTVRLISGRNTRPSAAQPIAQGPDRSGRSSGSGARSSRLMSR